MDEELRNRFLYFHERLKKRDKEISKLTETYTSCGVDLAIDIFLPDSETFPGKRPGVLFFFGGGFVMGCKEAFEPQAVELAKQGYITLCADYRVTVFHGTSPQDSIMDGVAAWEYMRKNADRWGIDVKRTAISGGSAGGLISAMIGPLSGVYPQALVLFNPAINLRGLTSPILQNLIDKELNGIPYPTVDSLQPGMPPMLILHGLDDDTIPAVKMKEYAEQAESLGIPVKTVFYPGVNHGFFNFNRSRPHYLMTLGEMMLFLDQTIGDNVVFGKKNDWIP